MSSRTTYLACEGIKTTGSTWPRASGFVGRWGAPWDVQHPTVTTCITAQAHREIGCASRQHHGQTTSSCISVRLMWSQYYAGERALQTQLKARNGEAS